MATNTVTSKWQGGMHFKAIVPPSKELDMDADEAVGGKGLGVRPKSLMLASLVGCTAMDVQSLLKKMRAEVEGIEINASGELTDEHPKYYKKVHVEYRFYGKEFKKDKIEKSVNLSVTRYCGVFEMFRQFAEMTHEIIYIEQ